MGTFVNLPANEIFPSQDYLKEQTVRHILRCLADADFDALPPSPIVRRHPGRPGYVAIDGHNLIAVRDFRNELVEVYVAESANDGLPLNNQAGTIDRNTELAAKYDSALEVSDVLAATGIKSFADLESKYPELFLAI